MTGPLDNEPRVAGEPSADKRGPGVSGEGLSPGLLTIDGVECVNADGLILMMQEAAEVSSLARQRLRSYHRHRELLFRPGVPDAELRAAAVAAVLKEAGFVQQPSGAFGL